MPAVRIAVRLTPRAGRDRVDGARDGVLLARVAAPPVDGAANEALVRLLARELGLGPSAVRLVVGTTARRKIVEIDADGAGAAVTRLWPGVTVG